MILPTLLPALITGFALAFARALGEYGSVVFVSGNMPFKTEIAPVLIVAALEEFAYARGHRDRRRAARHLVRHAARASTSSNAGARAIMADQSTTVAPPRRAHEDPPLGALAR